MDGEVRLLGPLEVRGPQEPVRWTGPRRRAVFALLALGSGRLVSRSSLIDALWGHRAPPTATATVQGHVAQVRKALSAAGLGGMVVTRDPGYLLDLRRVRVDVHEFDASARLGREALDRGDGHRAVDRLTAALGLWRGDPLADCPVTGWADAEVGRLREALTLVEENLAAALCLVGRHVEAIGELERLVARYPWRERLWELLVEAQHGAGRSVDALRTYRRVRAVLVEEFGLEPGPGLRRVEALVLA
ncbi:BTAD domain-containing putative transcriptional regulator [Umezawaea endophytica]|uniref:AfsR/SARP family transcriptional regulator n=1 Tax=Umezawaea endophytica TaxID=1654476 RepID=A0A9X2VF85_9PSEU|nr:AfsR/SARP family transcriptional regulator [Umezawaea endophytica]MCS7475384.1 AfsR/SARP family transcriptional regulator [Umezawaea endophytica]